MKVDLDNVEITVKQTCTEHTKLYVALLSQILNKGINNPAFQLHVLCMIHLGKTFNDLVHKDPDDKDKKPKTEDLINLIKSVPIGFLMKNMKFDDTGRPDVTDTTIDDFLGEKKDDNENTPN